MDAARSSVGSRLMYQCVLFRSTSSVPKCQQDNRLVDIYLTTDYADAPGFCSARSSPSDKERSRPESVGRGPLRHKAESLRGQA